MKQEKITPDKYFLSKVEEEHANVIGLIRDKKLIRYIIEQPDKSKEAIDNAESHSNGTIININIVIDKINVEEKDYLYWNN